MVEIGDTAPIVSVRITNDEDTNKIISLQDLYARADRQVFYFFPAAFTGVCTRSSCDLRDDIKEFSELGADIYGISTDMPFTQRIFRQQNDINYALLSDWNKEMIRSFGNEDNDFGGLTGVAQRSLFVVDQGKITYKWIAEHPGKYPPFDEVKQVLK